MVLDALRSALASNPSVVLQAPPGAGKSTRVPLALLNEPWLRGLRIVMLEPRRLAARTIARYMARQLGEEVGETVGYRMRLDSRIGPRTRIEVITEGVLERLLQADPALDGTGLLIFDEFHERSLQADVGLALALDVQRGLREDLKLLPMSATLERGPLAALLGNVPVISSEGRSFPVEIRYTPPLRDERNDARVTATIIQALREETGNLLVFLPGLGEIRQVAARLGELPLGDDVIVAPLYGNLSQPAQDQAIAPPPAGKRKVVLATSIAETSLTIEGIRVVIDSGLMRIPRFDPGSGMTRLETVRVSQASAAQRAGRAGRLMPGVCYRLWSENAQQGLVPFTRPEILDADLAPLVLQLAQWGVRDPNQLAWLDPPPAAAWAQAVTLLQRLNALDKDAHLTVHGAAMLGLGIHPRLAHMVLRARELGCGALACDVAVLLGERDILRGGRGASDVDMAERVRVLRREGGGDSQPVDKGALRNVRESARALRRQAGVRDESTDNDLAMLGVVLAFAYPDRIGQRRSGTHGRFLLSNGQGAMVPEQDPLAGAPYLVAAQLDGERTQARVFLAAAITLEDLMEHFADIVELKEEVRWSRRDQAVLVRRQLCLGSLVLRDEPLPHADRQAICAALLEGIKEQGIECLPWDEASRLRRARLRFILRSQQAGLRLPSTDAPWPDISDAGLLMSLDRWLAPYLEGMSRLDHVSRLSMDEILRSLLTWQQQQALDEFAPTHVTVPSGSRIAIDYESEDVPVLAVRLQEMFGQRDTPRIAMGQVALKLHLLSPARRPVQVTQDLASFWAKTYQDVKKDLKGRYPKHYWPDDPLQAEATRGVRRH